MRSSVLVLFAATAAIAAPVPKGEKPDELYYPVQVGAKRVMDVKVKTGQPGWTETETVTKVEEKDGKYQVTIERDNGKTKSEAYYLVSKDGLHRIATRGGVEVKPNLLLKLPYKEEATWTAEVGKAKVTYRLGKEEEIKVPAGKYKAIRVEVVAEAGGQTQKRTFWYAAGVGLIKEEMPNRTSELKEYTPGKADKK